MATIGQPLTAPESGWKRYDDTAVELNYVGNWTNNTNSGYYNSTIKHVNGDNGNSYLEFKFKGEALRIIGIDTFSTNSYVSNNIVIEIDGVNYNFDNNSNTPNAVFQALLFEVLNLPNENHKVKIYVGDNGRFWIDAIDINDDGFLLENLNKFLFKDSQSYKYYSTLSSEFVIIGSNITEETYDVLGISDLNVISEQAWSTLIGNVEILYYTDISSIEEVQFSIETESFTLSEELGSSFSIVEYTDNPTQEDSDITTEIESFSVYDYISESPEVLVYSESNDDITVETTTEPFTIYDEFGEEVEVLHYTDDSEVNQVDLILEANYSPIDELEGDFEIVTWTDEENSSRILQMEGELSPKLIYPTSKETIYDAISDLKVMFKNEVGNERFAITNNENSLFTWNGNSFVAITAENIASNGLTLSEINNIDISKWNYDSIGIVVYLDSKSELTSISYDSILQNKTPKVNDVSLYILNTTAKIDIELDGLTVNGILSDADSTRVQYRVILNDGYYYPRFGDWTNLTESPTTINLTLRSSDIKINDWNTLRVEFRDYFGTVDYWEVQFIGRYSGIMFRTTDGEYYSSDIGEVLRYLDFGVLVSGQTSLEQTVVLKNQFGYDISDVELMINKNMLPQGVVVEFSKSGQGDWRDSLPVADVMTVEEEINFDVRMRTALTSTPTPNGMFDIIVMAKRNT